MKGKMLWLPLLLGIGLIAALLALLITNETARTSCTPSGYDALQVNQTAGLPQQVGEYDAEQVANAAAIIAAGHELKAPARAQVIAVMTAMGESGLRVLDYGDSAGPDSRGLFQQRDNGAWGSLSDRMDPRISSLNFYRALLEVDDWQTLPPTIAAHHTQHNADPHHYEQWWPDAVAMTKALSGNDAITSMIGAGGLDDCDSSVLLAGAGAVVYPIPASLVDTDQENWHNSGGNWTSWHTGTDFSVACGTPVYAVHAGTVEIDRTEAWAGPQLVKVTLGPGKLTTWYAHMQSVDVAAGDVVRPGQQIGTAGAEGNTTGCHLHLEVHTAGGTIYGPDNVDPTRWLAENVGRTIDIDPAAQHGTNQQGSPSGDQSAAAPRVATFNVLGDHHTARGGGKASWADGVPRMRAAMQLLEASGVSLVGLQEFETPQAGVLLSTPGWSLYRGTPNSRFSGGSTSTIALAWRVDTWAALDTSELLIPWTLRDLHVPVVRLQHLPTGQQVIVVVVHNPATTRGQGDQSSARRDAVRRERQLVDQLRSRSRLPVILLGDFNERAPAYCALTAGGLLTHAAAPSGANGRCSPPSRLGVDQIYGAGLTWSGYRSNTRLLRRISDHPLVSALAQLR